MSTVLSPPTKLAPYLFRHTWTGTAPFRIFDYYEYKYIKTNTDLTQIDLVSPFASQALPIQVLDSTEGELDGLTYPGFARVQWRGQKDAYKYEVDNGLTILNWTPELGRGYYDFTFPHSLLSTVDDSAINLTAYNSVGDTVVTQAPALSTPSVPLMYNFALTYDSGTTTITVGAA